MYMLNGWWFLSSGGSYPLVFMVGLITQTLGRSTTVPTYYS